MEDENCKPYFIEDTEILDIYMELFEPFFKNPILLIRVTTVSKYTNNEVSMWLDDYLLMKYEDAFIYRNSTTIIP